MTRSLYVAGWNMPGHLPDSDPVVFETEDEATRYLVREIGLFWDEDYRVLSRGLPDRTHPASYLAGESHEVADNRWMDIHASLLYETAPYNVQNGDGSLTFWVTVVPRSDIPTFDSEGK